MKQYITDPNQLECYIVGGGPSLTNFDWSQLEGKFTIAINRAYEVLPNADIVYFTDNDWYNAHKYNLLTHTGMLIKGSIRPLQGLDPKITEYKLVNGKGLSEVKNQLCHGSNSTYAAINLAGVHLGFKQIYLLGIDLKYNKDQTHWHSGHARIDPESVYERMLTNYKKLAPSLERRNIKVFNINTPEMSDLNCFPFSDKLQLNYDGVPVKNDRPVQPVAPKTALPITYRMRQSQPITAKQRQEAMAERKRRMEEIRKINQPNQKKR